MKSNAFGLPNDPIGYNLMDSYFSKVSDDDKKRQLENMETLANSMGISGMGNIKAPGRIPYTEKQWNDFKEKMSATLRENALDSDEIFNDPNAKNYIVNYMQTEILSEKSDNERLILNINIRLAHLTIETATGKRVFPVILYYRGHHLFKMSYFYRDKLNNSIKMGTLEVNPKQIII